MRLSPIFLTIATFFLGTTNGLPKPANNDNHRTQPTPGNPLYEVFVPAGPPFRPVAEWVPATAVTGGGGQLSAPVRP